MAEECVRLLADNPESVRMVAFCGPDSVFGRNFLSDDELVSILDNLNALNAAVSSGPGMDFDDPKVGYMLGRCASVSDIIQGQVLGSGVPDGFSGWKVKALYECVDQFGDTVKNERHLIFDRDMRHIIHSFEIPIL